MHIYLGKSLHESLRNAAQHERIHKLGSDGRYRKKAWLEDENSIEGRMNNIYGICYCKNSELAWYFLPQYLPFLRMV